MASTAVYARTCTHRHARTVAASAPRPTGPLTCAWSLLLLLHLLAVVGCGHSQAAAAVYATLKVAVHEVINPDAQFGTANGYCDGALSLGCDTYFRVAVGSVKTAGMSVPTDFNADIGAFRTSQVWPDTKSFTPEWSTSYDISYPWPSGKTIYIS